MGAGFKLKSGVGAMADYPGDDFFIAAVFPISGVDNFNLPVLVFHIAVIHAKKVAREQSSFIAAGARAYLNKDIVVIIWIFWQQQYVELFFQFLLPSGRGLQFI